MKEKWEEILEEVVKSNLKAIEECLGLSQKEKERYSLDVMRFLQAEVRDVVLIPSGRRGVLKVMLEVRDGER